jgi:hypothetical protein
MRRRDHYLEEGEKAQIVALARTGEHIASIARIMRRGSKSVSHWLHEYGLEPVNGRNALTDAEALAIEDGARAGMTAVALSAKLQRSTATIRKYAKLAQINFRKLNRNRDCRFCWLAKDDEQKWRDAAARFGLTLSRCIAIALHQIVKRDLFHDIIGAVIVSPTIGAQVSQPALSASVQT